VLETPVVARAGDRFVLRALSPARTIGGGVVLDPAPPPRRARPWEPIDAGTPALRLGLALAEAGAAGLELRSLAVRLGVRPELVATLGAELSDAPRGVGTRLFAASVVEATRQRLVAALDEMHAAAPLADGVSLQELRLRLGAAPELADEVVRAAVRERAVEVEGGLARRAGWTPRLSEAQRAAQAAAVARIEAAGAEPPAISELAAELGSELPALLALAARQGAVVPVEPDRYWAPAAIGAVVARLDAALERGREYAPADLRDVLGVSRKWLMPLLEWLDRCALPEEQHLASPDYAATIAYEFVAGLIAAGTTTSLVFGSHFAPAVDALFAADRARAGR